MKHTNIVTNGFERLIEMSSSEVAWLPLNVGDEITTEEFRWKVVRRSFNIETDTLWVYVEPSDDYTKKNEDDLEQAFQRQSADGR